MLRIGSSAVSLLLLAACTFDSQLPPGTAVSCERDADCPVAGHACDAVLKRCVSLAPTLATAVTLEPTVGRAGTRFALTLAGEASSLSEVTLQLFSSTGLRVGAFEPGEATGVWAWTATGAEPEGELSVFLDARASDGHVVTLVRVASLTLDFTAPHPLSAQARLVPAPNNALASLGFASSLSALTVGTGATLAVELDEPMTGTPSAELECQGVVSAELSFHSVGNSARSLAFEGVLSAEPARQGPCDVFVVVRDAVGNEARGKLPLAGGLVIDTIAPMVPGVEDPEAVVFWRAPEGEAVPGTPVFKVVTQPSALSEEGVLVVSNADGIPLSRVLVRGDAGVQESLLRAVRDPIDVDVELVDLAGNESKVARVRDQAFVVFRPKLVGESPPVRSNTVGAPFPVEYEDSREMPLPGGGGWIGRTADGSMVLTRVDFAYLAPLYSIRLPIPARRRSAIANVSFTTPAGGSAGYFLFGGEDSSGRLLDDAWLIGTDGSAAVVFPAAAGPGPSPRAGATFLQSFLVGGEDDAGLVGDAWKLFNGPLADGGLGVAWQRLDAGIVLPSPRVEASVVPPYWLLGGRDDGGLLGDVWSLTSGVWVKAPFSLPPRLKPLTTNQSTSGKGFVYGGVGEDGGLLADQYLFNLTTLTRGLDGPKPAAGGLAVDTPAAGRGSIELIGGVPLVDGGVPSFFWYSTGTYSASFTPRLPALAVFPVAPESVAFSEGSGRIRAGGVTECADADCYTNYWPGVAWAWTGTRFEGAPSWAPHVYNVAAAAQTPAYWRGPVTEDSSDAGLVMLARTTVSNWALTRLGPQGHFKLDESSLPLGDAGVLDPLLAWWPSAQRFVTIERSTGLGLQGGVGVPWAPTPIAPGPLNVLGTLPGGDAVYGMGRGLYRLDATGWSTLSGEIDAGTFACGAFDSRRGEFLVVGAGAVVVALDGGTRRFQGAGCPLAFDSVRRKWVSFSTNRIDEFDSYASHSNLVTETSGSAALPGSGGFLSARVDLQFGGEGLDDAGAALPGARVWVEGGPQASNVATSTAPMSASFIIDPALVDDAGVAFSTSGRLRIAAQSLGVTGEGSANVELTSLKVVYRVRH